MENQQTKINSITSDYILPFLDDHKVLYKLITIFLILVVGFIAYQNIFDNSFHFDDTVWKDLEQVQNEDYSNLYRFNIFRIIPFASFTFDFHQYGDDPTGYYYSNFSIHIINSVLVFTLLLLLFRTPVLMGTTVAKYSPLIAFFGVMIFLTHPIQTQAVAYIYQRLASIAAMFYLITIVCYLASRLSQKMIRKIVYFLLAFISFVCALFSKENTFTLPIMIGLLEVFLLNKNYRIKPKYFIIFLVIIICVVSLAFFGMVNKYNESNLFINQETSSGDIITPYTYLLTQFRVLCTHWRLLFLPYGQHLDYCYPLSERFFELWTLLGFMFNLAVILIGILTFKKHRLFSFGIFWFYTTITVESSIIPIKDVMFEHRLYLPIVGFILMLMYVIFSLFRKKYLDYLIIFLVALVTLYSYLTYQRNRVWQNDGTLWTDTIRQSPQNARARNNRGLHFLKNKKYRLAINDFTKAVELNPKYVEPYSNRGTTYFFLKNYKQSLADFSKCIDLNSQVSETFLNRANVYIVLRNFDLAIKDLKHLAVKNPDESYAYMNLARCYRELHDFDNAIFYYEKYLEYKPKSTSSYINLAICYIKKQLYSNAIKTFDMGIEANPKDAELHFRKADLLMQLERHNEAIQEFKIVRRLKPDYPRLKIALQRYSIK